MATISCLQRSTVFKGEIQPSPVDFAAYLPWACNQLEIPYAVVVNRGHQNIYTPTSVRSSTRKSFRAVKTKHEKASEVETDGSTTIDKLSMKIKIDNIVLVKAIYDITDDLVQIKFIKNEHVPTKILQVISLIVKFQPNLTTINVDSGLDQDGLNEISNILSVTKITDVILDNTMVPQANYYILLDKESFMTYLSLARCSLNDVVIEKIVLRLPTSNLTVLNLSSNKIADEGAIYLGNALRTNRKLKYLNLSGNMITDIGADSILSSLTEFLLNPDEIYEKKTKYLAYLKQLNDLEAKITKEQEATEANKVHNKRQLVKEHDKNKSPIKTPRNKKLEPKLSQITPRTIAETMLGPFCDPFKLDEIVTKGGLNYCLGNNTLSCLSLAYNNLTYFSIQKLYNVLCTQKKLSRKPIGLMRVCIEGNNVPETCMELEEISYIINSTLHNDETLLKSRKS